MVELTVERDGAVQASASAQVEWLWLGGVWGKGAMDRVWGVQTSPSDPHTGRADPWR